VPVLSVSLQNRTPVIVPSLAAGTRRPAVTGLVSATSTAPDGAAPCQMLHGHCAIAQVLKLHVNGLLIGVPEAFCAPDTGAIHLPVADWISRNIGHPPDMLFTSAVSSCSIFGTPFIAARTLEGECLLATAALTCMSRTSQYPRGSAQAGIG